MSLIRRDLILFERADLKVVRKKVRRATVRLLLSATPNSDFMVKRRIVSPHIYRIPGTHTFVATRSGDLHEHATALNLTLENVYHFQHDGEKLIELINNKPFVPNEITELRAIEGRMRYARNNPPVYDQEEE